MPRKLFSDLPAAADSSSEDEEETASEGESQSEQEEIDGLVDGQNDFVEKPGESDDDVDEEEEQESPSLSAFTIKLHKPNKVGSKRSTESDESALPTKKKSKAAGVADEEEPKKGSVSQRLWSEGDELAILDGLVKYKSEKGVDPSTDMVAFHEFIKDSLHVDVSKNQLIDKIRRLKKKYRTNFERGENGQDPVFSKSHDLKAFELSKKVWGKNETVKRIGKVQSNGNSNGGRMQMQASPIVLKKGTVKSKEEVKSMEKNQSKKSKENTVENDEKIEDEVENVENLWEKYPLLGESLDMEDLSEGAKVVLRENLGMIDKSKLKALEHKWKSLKQAELELFVRREELVSEQVKLALDSIKS